MGLTTCGRAEGKPVSRYHSGLCLWSVTLDILEVSLPPHPAGSSICTRAETQAWVGARPPQLLDAGGAWVAFVTCAVRALRLQMRTDRASAGL